MHGHMNVKNHVIVLIFPDNNGNVKSPQYYVLRTLPVLLPPTFTPTCTV